MMKIRRKYWKKKTHTRRKTEYTNKSNIIIKLLKNRKNERKRIENSITQTHTCYYTLLLQKTKHTKKKTKH